MKSTRPPRDWLSIARGLSVEAQAVAASSQQALANAQSVSASAEELTASIGEIGQQVAKVSAVTNSRRGEERERPSSPFNPCRTSSRRLRI